MDAHTLEIIGAITVVAIDLIIRISLLFWVPRGRKPTAATAWLLAIFLVPGFVGIILFVLIGSTKLSKERRQRQDRIDSLIDIATVNQSENTSLAYSDRITPFIQLNKKLGRLPAVSGNHLTLLNNYQATIDSIVKDVKGAQQYIYIESFILALDTVTQPLFDALEAAVIRGVDVYVLFDSIGSHKYKNYKAMKKVLTKSGVHWRKMLSISFIPKKYNRPDLRNHRKLIAIDNAVAYIGSLNLIEPRYGRKDDIIYEELVSRMQGPIVAHTAAIIAGDWYSETGDVILHFQFVAQRKILHSELLQLLPSGSAYAHDNNLKLFISLMYAAKKKIVITNPYLVPDEGLLTALVTAAQRGVEVIVINSAAIDQWMVAHAQRSYYRELLDAGVKIYLHVAPVLLHSKHITIDDDIAIIGSSNMDIRSFELNMECILIAYDTSVVKKLRRMQKINIEASNVLSMEDWKKRSVWASFLDSVARLASALQ